MRGKKCKISKIERQVNKEMQQYIYIYKYGYEASEENIHHRRSTIHISESSQCILIHRENPLIQGMKAWPTLPTSNSTKNTKKAPPGAFAKKDSKELIWTNLLVFILEIVRIMGPMTLEDSEDWPKLTVTVVWNVFVVFFDVSFWHRHRSMRHCWSRLKCWDLMPLGTPLACQRFRIWAGMQHILFNDGWVDGWVVDCCQRFLQYQPRKNAPFKGTTPSKKLPQNDHRICIKFDPLNMGTVEWRFKTRRRFGVPGSQHVLTWAWGWKGERPWSLWAAEVVYRNIYIYIHIFFVEYANTFLNVYL